jgi:hypothetical protein
MAELNEFRGDCVADHACAEDCDFHLWLSLFEVGFKLLCCDYFPFGFQSLDCVHGLPDSFGLVDPLFAPAVGGFHGVLNSLVASLGFGGFVNPPDDSILLAGRQRLKVVRHTLGAKRPHQVRRDRHVRAIEDREPHANAIARFGVRFLSDFCLDANVMLPASGRKEAHLEGL